MDRLRMLCWLAVLVGFVSGQDNGTGAEAVEFEEYIASPDGLTCVSIKKRKFYPIRALDKACTKLHITPYVNTNGTVLYHQVASRVKYADQSGDKVEGVRCLKYLKPPKQQLEFAQCDESDVFQRWSKFMEINAEGNGIPTYIALSPSNPWNTRFHMVNSSSLVMSNIYSAPKTVLETATNPVVITADPTPAPTQAGKSETSSEASEKSLGDSIPGNSTIADLSSESTDEPWYLLWWIWAIAGLLILVLIILLLLICLRGRNRKAPSRETSQHLSSSSSHQNMGNEIDERTPLTTPESIVRSQSSSDSSLTSSNRDESPVVMKMGQNSPDVTVRADTVSIDETCEIRTTTSFGSDSE